MIIIGLTGPAGSGKDTVGDWLERDIENETGAAGYKRLAKKYNCGISTARDICTYRTR